MLTISEAALVFSCRAIAIDNQKGGVSILGKPSPANRGLLVKPGDREVEVGVLVEDHTAQGWTDYRPYCSLALGGTPQTNATAKMATSCRP